MRPKISIIVPVYNVEKYLKRCLDSLINQTLKDIEIIVVNDGSPDNSEEIINEYLKKDKRIVYLKEENGGLSKARNYGLTKVKGEYIGFVDSDDWVSLDMFNSMYKKAKETDSDVVICDYYKAYDDGVNNVIKGITNLTDDIKKDYIISSPCVWNKIYKANLISNNYFPVGMLHEDLATNPLLVTKINKVTYLNEALYYYYIRNNSIMNISKFNQKLYDILKASTIITDKVKNNKEYSCYQLEYEYLIIDNLLRDTYFRIKDMEGSNNLLNDIVIFIKNNYPHFMKNKYLKKRGFKYCVISYLIYKKQYKLLKMITKVRKG